MSQCQMQAEVRSSTGVYYLTLPVAIACLLLLAMPVALVAVPPLTDYPNHLARLWILMGGIDQPEISASYTVTWSTLTNVGVDVLAVLVRSVVPYEFFGRLMVAFAIVIVPVGAGLLWNALHGGHSWWPLSAGLLTWNASILSGFLNFQIGLGLAMVAAAADPAIERRSAAATAASRVLFAALLIAVHPFAFVFYAILLAGLTIGPDFRSITQRPGLTVVLRRLGRVAATLMVPALLFVLVTPVLPGTQSEIETASLLRDVERAFANFDWLYKLKGIFVGVRSYSLAFDALTLTIIGIPVLLALLQRRLGLHAGMAVAVFAILACYVLLPSELAGTGWVDRRFSLMLPFAMMAALRPNPSDGTARFVMVLLIAMVLGRIGFVAYVWTERQADVQAIARALEAVPATARILPLQHVPSMADRKTAPVRRFLETGGSYAHYATLALPWHHASFVPTLFASRGKQPVEVLARWKGIAEPDGGTPPSLRDLFREPSATDPSYVAGWREIFDYALVIGTDMPDQFGPFTPPADLALVTDAGFARLYRIVHPIRP